MWEIPFDTKCNSSQHAQSRRSAGGYRAGLFAIALALAAGALVGLADRTRAEELYPARPIRLVVGFGAGGPTDIPARFVADKLGQALGTRVVVENKPAAAGMIATRDALSQPRD